MRVTMAQLNPVVGDIDGNVRKVLDTLNIASEARADLVVFPELVLTGYPPKDLLEFPSFIEHAELALKRVVESSYIYPGMGIVLGNPEPTGLPDGKPLFNTAFLVSEGRVLFRQPKMLLPTYDVFDELRYFRAATENQFVVFKGEKLGLTICEDVWNEPDPWNRRPYPYDPVKMLAQKGASFFINISASPFSVGKESVRYRLLKEHARAHDSGFVFVNQVGGNDELVFDGRSLFVDRKGCARCVLPSFDQAVVTVETDVDGPAPGYEVEDDIDTVYRALVMGTSDYIRKCGFTEVVVGLSGGIDSAVTAAIAADAIGPQNVHAIAMPSRYSSPDSLADATEMSGILGIELQVIGIDGLMKGYDGALMKSFDGLESDVTEENIQARIRGNIIMAFSNKFGYLPLSTGNKSELSVGYCTLYGDMSGGLAVISDVPKTLVFKLADHINRGNTVIPRRIIQRPPSAELKPGQTDQDTLPPYHILDRILELHVDHHESIDGIVAAGFDRETVTWVVDTVRINEYKRKQAAPGLKVTSKAFGSGRRMPIAARYRL